MNRVIVVGPPGAGKSTFAAALSAELGMTLISVDADRGILYGPEYRQNDADTVFSRGGAPALHAYESPFELRALTALSEYEGRAVIDTGGGLLWQRTPASRAQLQHHLRGADCTVLCLPGDERTPAAEVTAVLVERLRERAQFDATVADWLDADGIKLTARLVHAANAIRPACDMVIDTRSPEWGTVCDPSAPE
ncbi:AAA family ATPase [Aldersonia sp. NBC_00410]|uniref:AAA family ATPase n=1 Tax=Aldersonia sp. NBC_00410 TaxID=2975954 RepID=UPI00225910B5|nr:AAA family ATPase [Aldersonia sp. NBC_00410]MCX5046669.1 AAA family ATPase [Aldersonia sp. NBC_00410]